MSRQFSKHSTCNLFRISTDSKDHSFQQIIPMLHPFQSNTHGNCRIFLKIECSCGFWSIQDPNTQKVDRSFNFQQHSEISNSETRFMVRFIEIRSYFRSSKRSEYCAVRSQCYIFWSWWVKTMLREFQIKS
jgi:hypothetical protein